MIADVSVSDQCGVGGKCGTSTGKYVCGLGD